MRGRLALVSAAVGLASGLAAAQGGTPADADAVCRGFCDADAKACRKESARDATHEVDPFLDFRGPRADRDDFTVEKHAQALRSADRDRFIGAQKCGDARLACRQRCATPAAPGASAAP